ncbi:hypothetical protein H7849_12055 [Alloacidobacterium dinghuense]|uniref:Uncharacterized protein n=1 Tax=Alloacidobacterium dinghuense TaxID=2763107 RepID=A0A7G8BPT7_9BACT|nr:hypothetical protein [Alloacidobacterium dinghuense]QNI34557.1 hypothetical protein H7849_12055 [Alloacidobacterium dinghuense]
MFRVQNLFALSSVAFLAFGFVLSKVPGAAGITLAISGHRGYGIASQTPLYLIGTLFGLFAFFYSIGYLSFNQTMAHWHFALSVLGVLLIIIGWALFPNANINLIVASIAVGLLFFLSAQLWFAFDITRAVVHLLGS